MLGLSFSSKIDCGSDIVCIAKTASKFLFPEVALYFYKLRGSLAWNTVVMSGWVLLLAATWIC